MAVKGDGIWSMSTQLRNYIQCIKAEESERLSMQEVYKYGNAVVIISDECCVTSQKEIDAIIESYTATVAREMARIRKQKDEKLLCNAEDNGAGERREKDDGGCDKKSIKVSREVKQTKDSEVEMIL